MLKVRRGCPNCRGEITSERLEKGLACEKCLGDETGQVCDILKESGKLKGLTEFCSAEEREREFEEFFIRALKSRPWSLQRQWAKRVFMGESFAMVAPAGVGKTTFGLIMSLFLEGKALLLFPTKLLASQARERLDAFSSRINSPRKVFLYKSGKKEKKRLSEGDFHILIGTNMFFRKNIEILKEQGFSFVFVDDIDSLLKSLPSVTGIFELLGFSRREIEDALAGKSVRAEGGRPILIVSSATLKPRGKVVNLFRILLGFDVQRASSTVRNILDLEEQTPDFEEAISRGISLVKQMGKGGLVFVSIVQGREGARKVKERFFGAGIRALLYDEVPPEELRARIEKGEVQVAIGISHSGNPLVRGLDLPHAIRYVLHLDVPKHVFSLRPSLRPSSLYGLLVSIYGILSEEERVKALSHMKYLRRYFGISPESLDRYPSLKRKLEGINSWISGFIQNEEFLRKLNSSPDVSLRFLEDEIQLVVADASSYIQAAGRASRLVAGRLTKGISLLLWHDEKAFRSLLKRLSYYFPNSEVEFLPLKKVDISKELQEVDRDRRIAKEVLSGKIPEDVRDLFKTTLVIVESPNKARTIAKFFGKPQLRTVGSLVAYEIPLGERLLTITASLGHVLDLVTDRGFFGVEEGRIFVPVYDTLKTCAEPRLQHTEEAYLKERCKGEIRDKLELLEGLQRLAFQADEIFIATDPDAEGEKIAYDLFLHLRPFNSDIKRAEFHEIRPAAFKASLKEPRGFSREMVRAQMVRRITDRWVGFVLSRVLWRVFSRNWFSAGRVQTPVLGWIIQREKEARRKKTRIILEFGDYTLQFDLGDSSLVRGIRKEDVKFGLEEVRREEISPPPPYSTDALLEDASTKLRLSASFTMSLLQELFEKGYITYHRTDSIRVSDAGKYSVAKPFILEKFSEEYFYPRTWGKGGAHECIRPTRPLSPENLEMMGKSGLEEFSSPRIFTLYRLIFNRFMASQMRNAKVKKGKLILSLPSLSRDFEVVLEVLQDGFNLIYPGFNVFPGTGKFSGLKTRVVPLKPLFTQGSLVAEMKRRGLGRPSTYAHIIQTLLSRGYVREKAGKLTSTPMGRKVYSFLKENYPEYTSEELTRTLEEAMDRVEKGELDWQKVLLSVHRVKELL